MSSTVWRTLGLGLFWVLCLSVALVSWRFIVGGVEATMGFVAYHAHLRPIGFYAHVIFAPIALAILPFQTWGGLRMKRPSVHRMLGRIYGVAVLVSGAGGLWLAVTTSSGFVAAIGFGLLAVTWLGTTCMGIKAARSYIFDAHRRWMIRSMALTLSAVTLRIYLGLTFAFSLPFDQAYPAIAWLCWVPNLLLAEWYIGRQTIVPLAAR